MKYLTTITIYNDAASLLNNHPKEFADKVLKACSGVYYRTGENGFYIAGNPTAIVQSPRNENDATIYVHYKGKVIEMQHNSTLTNDLFENNINFFDEILLYLQGEIKLLNEKKGIIEEEVNIWIWGTMTTLPIDQI